MPADALNTSIHDESEEELNEQLQQLLNLQVDLLNRAKNALRNYGRDGARRDNQIYYTTKLKAFSEMVDEFKKNHREIVRTVSSDDYKDYPYFTQDFVTQFEDAHIDYVSTLQTDHDQKFPSAQRPTAGDKEQHLTASAHLPAIDFPHFAGEPTKWKEFHDTFRSLIHTNVKLPGSHKFHYLRHALSGEAHDVIAGIEVCDEEYPTAWKTLCDIYNDKPTMFTHIMNKFTSMQSVDKEQPEQLRELMKATSMCLKSLDSIGIPQNNVDSVITYFLIRKLPAETLAYWEQMRDRKKLPSFEALKTCIDTRIRVASAVATVKIEPHSTSSSNHHRAEINNNIHQSKLSTKKKKVNAYHSTSKPTTSSANAVPSSSASGTSKSSKSTGKKFECPVCQGEGHPLRACNRFLALSAAERRDTVVKLKHCVNCLSYSHQEAKCTSSHTCFTCGERHHSLLHVGRAEASSHVAAHALSTAVPINACNARSDSISSFTTCTLLATAMVRVLDASGAPHSLRALIDQGSEANFITEAALTALQLSKKAVQAIISGIGSAHGQAKHITSLTIQSHYDRTFSIEVDALVMGRITTLLPSSGTRPQRWEHLVDLALADPSYHRPGRIDLVLGVDVLAQILMEGVRIGPTGTPIGQQTRLGWILSGKVAHNTSRNVTVTALHATSTIEELMAKFLSAESIDDANPMSAEEQWSEQFFVDTHRRDETGRFNVRLPFRRLFDPLTPPLGRSRDIAVRSLLALERRLAQKPELKNEYAKTINEYLAAGRMQPTTSIEVNRNGSVCSAYLPHHAVFKESSTTTKLRVVFDASRKTTSGQSLNDALLVGPTIQNDIVTIIINWRFHRIGITADVQKMYLQVKVDPQDIEHQRIVWRNDPSEPIQDFALNRLTFGTSCAPFIAIRSMNQLAEDEKSKYPDAATVIINDAYVDDVISGGDDVPSVQKLQRELSEMMKSGGFELKKWASNVSDVLELIPESDREIKLPVELNTHDTIKALGIIWNPATDTFQFKSSLDPNESNQHFTKRIVLSSVAKLFDPIGLIAPIIVLAKIFMKKLWAREPVLNWDDTLPPDLRDEWITYINELRFISEIKIPRWVNASKTNASFQIHGFCDASESAYGAAVYLRTIDSENNVHIHLIASKSKVSPTKTLTIPRLELCGALLLSRLLTVVRKGLRHTSIPCDDITLWCDSEIVCYWLRSTKPLKVYVATRVGKIHEATTGIRWRHVRTHDNPADLVSRGVTPRQLASNSLWWHGPSWLRLPSTEWPTSPIDVGQTIPPENIDLEHRRVVIVNICTTPDDLIQRFSNYNRMIRVISWCRRFLHNHYRPSERISGPLTIDELQLTRRRLILKTQREYYNDEIQCLTLDPPDELHHRSKLRSLTPFIDGNGIMRVQGRLEHSLLPYNEMHPIILPPNAHFTRLIIDHFHRCTSHGGAQLMMSVIRRQYWIINGRTCIRHHNHRCIECFRHRGDTLRQLMGSLPPARVRPTSRPFVHVGVDYCGPFDVRASKGRGITSYKAYIAVFVCLTVKAVHIELVDGLTTDAFLAAFRRFVARRGLPSDVYSDNGTNFLGAANELERQFQRITQENEINAAERLTTDNIRWHFIPPASPHMGGIWERSVRSVKHHLRRVIGESKLAYEPMHTLLCQIEACLNSRPLCPRNDDPTDLSALTPAHFLVNSDLLTVPEPSLLDENPNRIRHWQQIQQMRQSFWKRWTADYLSLLQQRPKWQQLRTNLKVGELVLVQDDRLGQHKWPLGRVVETHPGDDGNVRVVTIRTAQGIYKRNITKLSRLPIPYPDDDEPTAHATEEEEELSSA